MSEVRIELPSIFLDLFRPKRYKIYYGGRGSAKSRSFGTALIAKAREKKIRALCCREFQNSMDDSVKKLLADEIERQGLIGEFEVQKTTIFSRKNGSEILFKGLARDIQGVKSTENIDICWVEEAQTLSSESIATLLPTIRAEGSEIWFSYNPISEDDPMSKLKDDLVKRPDLAIIHKVGWQDNPWFPKELDEERLRLLESDPLLYQHVWEGDYMTRGDALIFKDRMEFKEFQSPKTMRYFYGADWGFANDPTVLIRCFIKDEVLYIDHEAFGYRAELDELPALFDRVPGARLWPIKCDNSKPECIAYMAKKGFRTLPAKKWSGSVEDGVKRMQAFRKIVVHPRCPKISEEFRKYSYKVDKRTNDVLPTIMDTYNHGIDATRYALDGIIVNGGRAPVFNPGNIGIL